jgi:hypothetical protein
MDQKQEPEVPGFFQALANRARLHPGRFGWAAIFGTAVSLLPGFLEPTLRPLFEVPAHAPLAVGLFGFLVALLAPRYVMLRQSAFYDPRVYTAAYLIEKANFSELERRQNYRQLIGAVMTKIAS